MSILKNSNINLSDGGHIKIVWSFSNAVKTHNVNIFQQKIWQLEDQLTKL